MSTNSVFYKIGDSSRIMLERTGDLAKVVIPSPNYKPDCMLDEYIKYLGKHEKEDIKVFLSGGLDSEIAAYACEVAGIKYTPVIGLFELNGVVYNVPDVQNAFSFCAVNKKQPHVLTVNLNQFLEGMEFVSYAQEYECTSPQLCVHLWMMDQVEGHIVIGGDPIGLGIVNGKSELMYKEYKYFSYDIYFNKNNRQGTGCMAAQSPEIMLSTLNTYLQLAEQGYFFEDSISRNEAFRGYQDRHRLYVAGGFDVEMKKRKYTGFEDILRYYQAKYNGEHVYQVFNNKFRRPLERRLNLPTNKIFVEYFPEAEQIKNEYQHKYDTHLKLRQLQSSS